MLGVAGCATVRVVLARAAMQCAWQVLALGTRLGAASTSAVFENCFACACEKKAWECWVRSISVSLTAEECKKLHRQEQTTGTSGVGLILQSTALGFLL